MKNNYSSKNNTIDLNQEFIEFFRIYFINEEYKPEKALIIRYYISLLQTYIESNKKFDTNLINSWKNEVKPYILQKFPPKQDGLFTVNSDLEYLIQIIDSLKEEYENKQKESEINAINKTNDNLTDNNNKNVEETEKNSDKNSEIQSEEFHHKSLQFFGKIKRVGTNKNLNTIEDLKNNGNIDNNKDNNKNIINNNEDIKKLRKENKSKINQFLKEFIQENIVPLRRTNSMMEIRPHSQTVDSKTTCESSKKERMSILNIDKFLADIKDYNNESKDNKDNNDNDIEKDIAKNEENNTNTSNSKKPKKIYGNIFMEGEEVDPEKNQKIKTHLRSKSITLLREMTPIYKENVEDEGYSIIYKMPEKTLTYIYIDILLKKIIFEDFIKNNTLLIYHFCQQCFCFVNKEIFFRKLFHCYKFYKNNISKEKIKNLIELINILVIEMFEYYQKINLSEIHITHIKNFYNELIYDLVQSLDIDGPSNENEDNINEDDNNLKQFRFESLDYSDYKEFKNRNSSINYNYLINKDNLINMNLNTEIKNIKIFIYKDKETKLEDNIEKEKEDKEISSQSNNVSKSVMYRAPSLPNPKLFKSSNKNIKKDFKEDIKKSNLKNEEDKSNKTSKIISLSWNFRNEDEEKEEKEGKEEEKDPKLEVGENEESAELNEQKKEKKKLFQISKTLRKSHIMPAKKILKDVIIEEDEDIKEKSDEEELHKKNKELYSDKSESEHNSSISSKNDSDSNSESIKSEDETNKDLKIDKKESKEINEKEEEDKQKLEILKNVLEENNIPEKLISLNEKIMEEIQYIIFLFENEDGEPLYQEMREAKSHLSFYKNLQNILNKQKKKLILPIQRQKRMTKSYSSIFSLGAAASKTNKTTRDYLSKGYFCITDWKKEEIGDQLMKNSMSLLNKVQPRELYRAIFLKKDKEKTSPNVVKCVNNFNRLTSFIIEDILSYNLPRERARMYDKWVEIADYCKANKDYNDLIAIFSALNNYVITGLKLTLKEVKSRTNNLFRQISEFCTVEGNYKNIREDMNNCEKTGEIFIPYLGMLMRDINFMEESSKYINENGCINMEKIENINVLFEKYFKFKNKVDKKNKIKELMFFEDLEDITEEELEQIGYNIEPEFKLEEIQKPGKRLTKIDKKYFAEYKTKSLTFGNREFARKTISGFL